MHKQNYLYCLIGVLIGALVGYFGTDYINRNAAPIPAASGASGDIANAGPVPAPGALADSDAPAGGDAQAEVTATIEQARREPANFDAQLKAANLFKQINRSEGAIEFYESAARIKPNDFNLLVTLGDTHFDLKRFDDAAVWYERAVKLNANSATVWLDLGSSYYLRPGRTPADLEKAIAAYRAAIKSDPRGEKALQNLTQALLDKGDQAGARAALAQLEQVNPGNSAIGQFRAKLN